MESKTSCILCGTTILATTADRTGGKCMLCFSANERLLAAARLGAATPTAKLLEVIEKSAAEAAIRVAQNAAAMLAEKQIYGCWLFHTQFLTIAGVTIFTETGLDQVFNDYAKSKYPSTRAGLRWSPCDSPHHLFHSDDFAETEHLFLALEHQENDEAIGDEVERICLRTVQKVREASIFPPHVVLTLAEGDQSNEERYAYAECFSMPEALQSFRAELPALNNIHLDHWRARIPIF